MERSYSSEKIFLHYDMDAFFASVEQRDNPQLKGIPIAVGFGVVTTANYEARKFGVKSAMPTVTAKKLCPNLKLLPVRKNYYSNIGKEIQGLIKKFTNKYEFTSIDEGYIDITEFVKTDNIEKFIIKFKKYIFKNVGLTCSVGIGFSKVSAKIASDINKPDNYFIFYNREQFLEYIKDKNLSLIPGIGKKTREQLKLFNIFTVSELYKVEKRELIKKFGESRGEYLYNVIRGIQYSDIDNNRKRQSYGHEITFNQSMNDILELQDELKIQAEKLSKRLKENKEFAKTVTLKIRYSNFVTYTKAKTLKFAVDDTEYIFNSAMENFRLLKKKDEVKLIGIHLSSITKSNIIQLSFNELKK
ncbi:DNA polymerase IV [Leptotrichia sp. OH3620_COT-345]|uniref:DNA polymerase IV n=1 Tax=Leptotrichia sp. OH3620_COT-345 TaxID=2491048 RepID=UPI000F6507CE|nr:DNA polymerase IV [Leptotrichia sp. OH3620_COT-345]RRD38949.1 DNA polymerase IV [Leptotrichia sp. OH3620_COT-345]